MLRKGIEVKMNDKGVFTAPGRIEIGGSHTDHQCGRVLAAAIDLDMTCNAAVNGTDTINITSDGFGAAAVDLNDLDIRGDEKGTMAALIRGEAAWFKKKKYAICGFDATVTSRLPVGAGLSSSAAFEVLIGNAFKGLFGLDVSPLDIAIAGRFAENIYFGKPCGLMDQVASSFGGLTMIDFADPLNPVITPVNANLKGYTICITNTGGSHTDMAGDYSAIPHEMKIIAGFFGKKYLREVSPADLSANMPKLRQFGDRATLRAFHFFKENERVEAQATLLSEGDITGFLNLVSESGRSSIAYLQNVFSASTPNRQELMLALMLSDALLEGKGAYRVHGGGFAGTILAFVPDGMKEEYRRSMAEVFGESACQFVNVRACGGGKV